MRPIITAGLVGSYGSSPVRHSYNIAPHAYRSARWSTSASISCSGAMYPGVPTAMPALVSPVVRTASRAMPKSMTLSVPSAISMMLCGLMSRCTMP